MLKRLVAGIRFDLVRRFSVRIWRAIDIQVVFDLIRKMRGLKSLVVELPPYGDALDERALKVISALPLVQLSLTNIIADHALTASLPKSLRHLCLYDVEEYHEISVKSVTVHDSGGIGG